MSKKIARLTSALNASGRSRKRRRVRVFVARKASDSFRRVVLAALGLGALLGGLCFHLL